MASTVEQCRTEINECKIEEPIVWREDIPILIAAEDTDRAQEVAEILESVSSYLKSKIGISLVKSSQKRFIIYVGDEQVDASILAGETLINPEQYKEITSQNRLACFGNVFWEDKAIFGAVVYVNGNLQNERFRRCVEEEVFNALGLFSDPAGYASLFDYAPFLDKASFPYYSDTLSAYL